ncbi:hypothetical protein D3C72_609130 [compost metagenome]
MLAHLGLHGGHHFLVPDLREAAARAVFGHAEIGQRGVVQHQVHLGLQALAALFPVGVLAGVAEVDLVDDGQHRDLEQNRVQPGAFHFNRDLAGRIAFADVDAALGQVEQAEEIDEVAFDEAQAAQVIQFVLGEAQLAQLVHLFADFIQIGAQVGPSGAALVTVLDLCSGKLMQYHLHHAEFIQIGVEQRGDYHGCAYRFATP